MILQRKYGRLFLIARLSARCARMSARVQLLFMIGEHFSDESEVLGTVISLRKGRNKLALWTRSSQDRSLLMRVGTEWKRALQLPQSVLISFVSHSTTMKGGKNSFDLKPQYTV